MLRRLPVIEPRPVHVDRHAEPDLTEASAARLLDDPETLWRHMNVWRAAR
jgi:hypothetical protein